MEFTLIWPLSSYPQFNRSFDIIFQKICKVFDHPIYQSKRCYCTNGSVYRLEILSDINDNSAASDNFSVVWNRRSKTRDDRLSVTIVTNQFNRCPLRSCILTILRCTFIYCTAKYKNLYQTFYLCWRVGI